MVNQIKRVSVAEVRIWGQVVGAIGWDGSSNFGTFEFNPDFLETGLDLAPIMMPLERALAGETRFEFRRLPFETYHGLPGLLSDSLPDKFGNDLINQWLVRMGRIQSDINPIERLCYTGKRGMGALEFRPVMQKELEESVQVEVTRLVELAREVLNKRNSLEGDLFDDPTNAILNIIRVGTSAGGNRPKAVIAWNESTGEIRSGQVAAPKDFDYWIIKFDGVKDTSLNDPAGFGRIEYAYHLMARACGIDMTPCRLQEEGNRAHFMTRRFDRPGGKDKLHVSSLCGMAHYDFNMQGAYSYEQAFQVMRELRLPYTDAEQQYRRMVFNVIARNQDDHTKNIAFIMDRQGGWRLSPAFDMTFAHNPAGKWTNRHQMTINGKSDGFTLADLYQVGREMNIKSYKSIVQQVRDVVAGWPQYAQEAGVGKEQTLGIGEAHRLML